MADAEETHKESVPADEEDAVDETAQAPVSRPPTPGPEGPTPAKLAVPDQFSESESSQHVESPPPPVKQKRTAKQEASLKKATAARQRELKAMQAERDRKRAIEEEERLLAAAERIKQRKLKEKKEAAALRKAEREARKPQPKPSEAKPLSSKKTAYVQEPEHVTVSFTQNPFNIPYWK